MPQEPKAREGYQLCHGCCDVAYCSLQCKHKGSSNHAYVCKTPVPPSMYKVFAPNIWSIPSPMYTSLLDRILQRTLCTTLGDESPLSHEWVKTIHGNLGVPRQLRSDSDTSREGHACAWDESNSVSMAHLYPQWKTLMELTAGFEEHREQRKDSKHEEETPKSGGSAYKTSSDNVDGEDFERAHPHLRRTTSGLMMDWSYDTNVCQPLHLLYTIGRRHSRRSGLQLMLDVTRYDGWVLETLRAKVQAGLGVQEFPKTKIQFDDEGVRTAVHRFERSMEKDPYGPPLFGTDHDRWIASMHPLMTGLRDAKGDEEPNVRVLDRDGRLHVTALRDIEAGEVLLR
ncbi:hypothetical protein K491DRAFT_175268 [Lophiostoma macrostomum CBS 122681]|uniref:Suppressor of anucleate metulae protein B n=1 Tax=Lophiostoma macrostomum CBS 122681 TaxID=1314788 RepID=A0A6A6SP21_9PLEO|nr:hypothetical protein K491DRAFT_175268 [Lophiostoma macrostomum CBS 122681]